VLGSSIGSYVAVMLSTRDKTRTHYVSCFLE
jgi:hypothetical protein